MKQPLPGLEATAATLEGLSAYAPQARKAAYRQIIKHTLAERILGHSAALEWNGAELGIHEREPEEDSGPGEALKTRMAALLMLSASDENNAVGTFNGNDGENFDGSAVLWKSSLRLDPSWMETMRRRTRRTAKDRFEAMRAELRKHVAEWVAYRRKDRTWSYGDRMLGLTMNKVPGACTVDEVKRFNAALRLLFRSPWWRSQVTGTPTRLPAILGGIKAVEDALSAEGPHVHGHFLLIARRLDQVRLHEEWTKALRKATRQAYGLPIAQSFAVNVPDLRTVTKKAPQPGRKDLIGYEDALDEVCKYLTKPSDLLEPHVNRAGRTVQPPAGDVLLALALVERWPRMFELFGAARRSPEPAQRPSLDTSCISVQAARIEAPAYWEEGAIEPEERADFRLKCAAASCLGVKIRRPRPPSWRQLMFTMGLHEWLQVVAARFRSGIRFRESWLRSYNPNLYLVTLDGRKIVADAWQEECML